MGSMIKITHQEIEFQCETVQEAIELAHALTGKMLAVKTANAPFVAGITAVTQPSNVSVDLEKLVHFMQEYSELEVDSSTIVNYFNLKDPKGVGPFLRAARRRLKEIDDSIELDDLMRRRQRGAGPVTWLVEGRVALHKLHKVINLVSLL